VGAGVACEFARKVAPSAAREPPRSMFHVLFNISRSLEPDPR
jgi:hypothetical protein